MKLEHIYELCPGSKFPFDICLIHTRNKIQTNDLITKHLKTFKNLFSDYSLMFRYLRHHQNACKQSINAFY